MALSLGVQAGSNIMIGQSRLHVLEVLDNGLQVKIDVRGRLFMVSDEERVEVMRNVFVFCGVSSHMNWNMPHKSKLAFEAPLDIHIYREGVTA